MNLQLERSDTETPATEIGRMSLMQMLAQAGGLECWTAQAFEMPLLFGEIVRLRGREADRYDAHYRHVFLWDNGKKAVAGGCRLGFTDLIMETYGMDGFASRQAWDELGLEPKAPALEIGRLFVAEGYRGKFAPAALLGRGIRAFVESYPRYRRVFGGERRLGRPYFRSSKA